MEIKSRQWKKRPQDHHPSRQLELFVLATILLQTRNNSEIPILVLFFHSTIPINRLNGAARLAWLPRYYMRRNRAGSRNFPKGHGRLILGQKQAGEERLLAPPPPIAISDGKQNYLPSLFWSWLWSLFWPLF